MRLELSRGYQLHYTGVDMRLDDGMVRGGRARCWRQRCAAVLGIRDATDSRPRQRRGQEALGSSRGTRVWGRRRRWRWEFVVVELVLHAACIRVRHSAQLFSTDFILFFADPGQCLEPSQQAEGRSSSAPNWAIGVFWPLDLR